MYADALFNIYKQTQTHPDKNTLAQIYTQRAREIEKMAFM